LEEASAAKGLVQRGVTELVTPGSVVGEAFLAPENNFLASLCVVDDRVGLVLCDASTGEVKLGETRRDEVESVLGGVAVSEWLLEPSSTGNESRGAELISGRGGSVTTQPPGRFDPDAARAVLRARWGERTLEPLDDLPLALRAAGAALDYLDRVQGGAALQMTRVERLRPDDHLRYDQATARHLELFQPGPGGEPRHALWAHLAPPWGPPPTPPVPARAWGPLPAFPDRPLVGLEPIRERHDAVAGWLSESETRLGFREALRELPDLERLISRVACAKATPRDL